MLREVSTQSNHSYMADILTSDDWDILTHMLALLKPFKQQTLRLEGDAREGSKGAVWEILPAMDILLEHLESAKVEYEFSEHMHLKACINNAWIKLDKYYNMTELSSVYVAALVLHPRYKWAYFEKKWSQCPD